MKIAYELNHERVFDEKEMFKRKFGTLFSNHVFVMKFNNHRGWHDARITYDNNVGLKYSSIVFHYGQEIYEGMKAYRDDKGSVFLFRPEQNARRFNMSAKRICMPEISEKDFLQAITELVWIDKDWVPKTAEAALYIRPVMIGITEDISLSVSDEYMFYVVLSPVAPYFSGSKDYISLYVETNMARTITGGIGAAKTGGNYAASLLAAERAHSLGCEQVLWLDGATKTNIEETGIMNIFFVAGDTLLTPKLTDTILDGITRNSVLMIAEKMNLKIMETTLCLKDTLKDIENGIITECFGTGTAAGIAPVNRLVCNQNTYVIGNGKVGSITEKIKRMLTGIQYNLCEDTFGWRFKVKEKEV